MIHFRKCLLLALLVHLSVTLCDVDALSLTSGERIASRRIDRQDVKKHLNPGSIHSSSSILHVDNQKKKSWLDLPSMEEWCGQRDLKEHHLKGLYHLIFHGNGMHGYNNNDDDEITQEDLESIGFPKRFISELISDFEMTCSIVRVENSAGGLKFVIQLSENQFVETVLIRHDTKSKDDKQEKEHHEHQNADNLENTNERYTICVSSQVGCARKCSFCATGTMGLRGNLSSGQILEQIYLVQHYVYKQQYHPSTFEHRRKRLRFNCVFMGMGEPLDNYNHVHESLRGLTHQCLFAMNAKQVTISTVGASPDKIRLLADEAPQVSLAFSLHSAIPRTRQKLIPTMVTSSKNNSDMDDTMLELGKALDYHASKNKKKRGAMIEYLLIHGVNDSIQEQEALVEFCQQRQKAGFVFVNLIPYNPTIAGDQFDYQTPSKERIVAFHEHLKKRGIKSLIRWSSATGRDANGACGQLALTSTTTQ